MLKVLARIDHWTTEEINQLKELWSIKTYEELSVHFNRSLKGIRQKVKDLNLPSKKRHCERWTEEEEKLIKTFYQKNLSLNSIAKKLNRTPQSVRLRANRQLNIFKSDIHLQENFRSKNFYLALKETLRRKSAGSKCCLCDYSLFVDLHHIDGNRKNNLINNIASLCPNHHRELERGMHKEKQLYCIWWRIYSDSSTSEKFNNNNLKENYQSV